MQNQVSAQFGFFLKGVNERSGHKLRRDALACKWRHTSRVDTSPEDRQEAPVSVLGGSGAPSESVWRTQASQFDLPQRQLAVSLAGRPSQTGSPNFGKRFAVLSERRYDRDKQVQRVGQALYTNCRIIPGIRSGQHVCLDTYASLQT